MARTRPIFALLSLVLLATEASAAGLLVPRGGGDPIRLKSHRVTAEIADGLAKTTLRQTFVNQHERALEAIYLFPLPEGAALVAVAMETGGQRYEGLLAERQRARRLYDEIVHQRRDPALVEQVGRSAFRLSVFPVLPGKETVVELTWIERVPLSQGAYRYVYPLAAEGPAAATEQDLTFSLRVRSGAPIVEVASPNRGMDIVKKGPTEALASLERVGATLDEDLVVTARVEVEKPTLTVATARAAAGDGWFTAVVTPPKARPEQIVPRDLILVVDTSGSMKGGKIEQARNAAIYLLLNLRPSDRVNVIRFSSEAEPFANEPVPATPENVGKLAEFVGTFTATGGTALGDGLTRGLAIPKVEGRVRTVVLLTDGRPTLGEQDPGKLVGMAKDGRERGLRVFPFGVGHDLDASLLEGIARASGGRAEIFRREEQLETRLTAFLDRTSSPVISDLAVKVDGVVAYDLLPRPLPDGYLGEQVVVCGRYKGGGPGTVTVSGRVGGSPASISTAVDFRTEAGGPGGVRMLFANEKLGFLEDALRLRLGLPDEAYYAVLQRGAYTTRDEIVGEIVNVSLEHGVQCPFTSFIVLVPEDRARLSGRAGEDLTAAVQRAGNRVEELAKEAGVSPEIESVEGLLRLPFTLGAGGWEDDAQSHGGFQIFTGGTGVNERQVRRFGGKGASMGGQRKAQPLFGKADESDEAPAAEKKAESNRHAVSAFYDRRARRAGYARKSASREAEAAVDAGLGWLAAKQEKNGAWKAGPDAKPGYEVGVTALSVLSFLGAGESPLEGEHRALVLKGLQWLMTKQDAEGCFGDRKSERYSYGHAMATLALAEAYGMTGSIFLKDSAQRAVDFIGKCQNPYLAWRYGVRPGDNDTSVTAWMVCALAAAKQAGLRVEQAGFDGAAAWIDKVTEPEYGRVGYTARGTGPCRETADLDRFPSDRSESLTAAGILIRVLVGRSPEKSEPIARGTDLCLKAPPVWSPESGYVDLYYWYFGTMAMFQVGGDSWRDWEKALAEAVLPHQIDGDEDEGSWAPIGPWGKYGGRVYATALMTMSLEAPYRYPKLFEGTITSGESRPRGHRLR